jgi:hypothetical protein
MSLSGKITFNAKGFLIPLIFFGLLLHSCLKNNGENESNLITVWYGDEQSFGVPGLAQRWINITGTIECEGMTEPKAYFRLNSGEVIDLALGPNENRLAGRGDFNVELCHSSLFQGNNKLTVYITDKNEIKDSTSVAIWFQKGETWKLPYEVNWENVSNVQDVIHIVDGNWELGNEGIRTHEPLYDRMFAFGDGNWTDYEVTTSVVFHNFLPPSPGPPSYWSSHVAIILRWPGHAKDDHKPHVKWYPLGASCEFQLFENLENCGWRIFTGIDQETGRLNYAEEQNKRQSIQLGEKYSLKARVETQPDGSALYSCKLWPNNSSEPENWDLQTKKDSDLNDVKGGSVLLVAHNSEVTFGNIKVIPLPR